MSMRLFTRSLQAHPGHSNMKPDCQAVFLHLLYPFYPFLHRLTVGYQVVPPTIKCSTPVQNVSDMNGCWYSFTLFFTIYAPLILSGDVHKLYCIMITSACKMLKIQDHMKNSCLHVGLRFLNYSL